VNPKNIFIELKRRNVYRAAVAYAVVAWFLTQLSTQVFPFFEIPNSAVRLVVIALAVGFPIAMLLSWVYEFTREGVVRTEDVQPAQARSVQRTTGRILDFIIIGALVLVIAMLIVERLPFYRQTGDSIVEKSVAVLPFENMAVIAVEKDAVGGPASIEILARVAAQIGGPNRAIVALQKLLAIPYESAQSSGMPLTPALLRFDPLRGNPRFEKLAASDSPK
jgi:hypothetical protein